jgi:hypothetical protein
MEAKLASYIENYQKEGLCIIPVPFREKAAKIQWGELQNRLPTEQELSAWFDKNNTNIAVICGRISGNLVALDCDSREIFYDLSKKICQNINVKDIREFTRISQTARGFQIWLRTQEPVKSNKFPKLDIKGEGGYVVAPPSIHPSGKQYAFLNPKTPIRAIKDLREIGVDIQQEEPTRDKEPHWVTELLRGVSEGQRNDSCLRLAGYFKNHHPKDITEQILKDWNTKNVPPLSTSEVLATVDSAYKYNVVNNSLFINNNREREDFLPPDDFSLKSGQVGGQVVDKSRSYGELSQPFDDFLRENPEPHWKKDVAEYIGTSYRDRTFIKLVQRRVRDGAVKVRHGGDKIQWVNRDWEKSEISLSAGERTFLDLLLPFGGEKYIAIPERSQIVVAGDVGSGKTHFGYLIAELNVGNLPIRHFVNEIGDSKAIRNLDDFPRLLQDLGKGYHLINQDREGLDVAENLDPNGLNIFDYLHLPSNKEWFLGLQQGLARFSQKIERGIFVVMLQKKQGSLLAMGGDVTRMQSEIYLTLNIEEDVEGDANEYGYKVGRVDVVKCKDWVSKINPETRCCRYRTAPKHGQLVADGKGWIRKEKT